ncbi:MAG: hypothetical protein F4210_14775 [Holophagales bacterium]|nr:hypothetical protein [Holophagales bacterium]MYF96741.1 hypothetical protein [Holophagales bacterium]
MSVSYESIRDELRTGDIVLYSGKRPISAIIKLSTFSRWSHVGIVVRLHEFDFVTVWESTKKGTGLLDLDSATLRKGVQLVALSERVETYRGDIAFRRLSGAEFESGDYERLWELRRELRDKPYETDRLELVKAACDGPFGLNEEDLRSIFCSELVAEAYQRLGLLDESKPSNEYVPADFSAARGLRLLRGELGPELEVKDRP